MQKKSIQKVMRKKFRKWTDTIDDRKVKELVLENSVITGGSIVSLLLGEPVNDFDVYFTDRKTVEAVARYYVSQYKEKRKEEDAFCNMGVDVTEAGRVKIVIYSEGVEGEIGIETEQDPAVEESDDNVERLSGLFQELKEEDEEKVPYEPVFFSTNAITLRNKIQVVLRFYGKPKEIHENFDFEHCKCYWQSKGLIGNDKLFLRKSSLECIIGQELRYNGSLYPVCSLIRLRKFLKRDWKIHAGHILKMCYQVSQLNLNDIEVLEEQLTGVDFFYFQELITKMQKRQDEGKDITESYLAEVIDEIF